MLVTILFDVSWDKLSNASPFSVVIALMAGSDIDMMLLSDRECSDVALIAFSKSDSVLLLQKTKNHA